ncbi:hypothetical protein CC2G_003124 [Coprinopsis cinerea AmutBmut pab1-1]|nr:hypothetical protein CC2G_003124 [Coprinopsis cinerea AmutBmut pab1-1]
MEPNTDKLGSDSALSSSSLVTPEGYVGVECTLQARKRLSSFCFTNPLLSHAFDVSCPLSDNSYCSPGKDNISRSRLFSLDVSHLSTTDASSKSFTKKTTDDEGRPFAPSIPH